MTEKSLPGTFNAVLLHAIVPRNGSLGIIIEEYLKLLVDMMRKRERSGCGDFEQGRQLR